LSQDFIKFDSVKISEVSANLDRQHKRFVDYTSKIREKADSLKGVWQGDSATLYAEKIKELDKISKEISTRFVSYTQELAIVAGIYKNGENTAKTESTGLPTGVLTI